MMATRRIVNDGYRPITEGYRPQKPSERTAIDRPRELSQSRERPLPPKGGSSAKQPTPKK